MFAARQRLDTSRWVRLVADDQQDDGGWGRFHSSDTHSKQKTRTTEQGVWRALALGLDAEHPILSQAADYCASVLRGDRPFADRAETNDRWQTGWRMFTASVLAQIRPADPLLDPVYDLWGEITRRIFASGGYSQSAEIAAHRDLTGATVENSYLELQNRYALTLLAACGMPPDLEVLLLDWLWSLPGGLHYLEAPLNCETVPEKAGPRDRWFESLELLSCFLTWPSLRTRIEPVLWPLIQSNDRWDFGPRPSWSSTLPLSENWRRAGKRSHDWTVRVLSLLV